jgi:hypothetical protein
MLEAKTGDKIPMEKEDRAALIDSIKTQAAPLKERETVSVRPCCQDIIFAYKAIEGIGRPHNMAVNVAALWEEEPLAKIDALTAMLDDIEKYFSEYSYPPKPIDKKPE